MIDDMIDQNEVTFAGVTYEAVDATVGGCRDCAFGSIYKYCDQVKCTDLGRKDKRSVIFIKRGNAIPEALPEATPEAPNRHKHADLIIAWANGAEIEFSVDGEYWSKIETVPNWQESGHYRIKPEVKPDVVRYATIENNIGSGYRVGDSNVKFVYDGTTGILKSVEMLTASE